MSAESTSLQHVSVAACRELAFIAYAWTWRKGSSSFVEDIIVGWVEDTIGCRQGQSMYETCVELWETCCNDVWAAVDCSCGELGGAGDAPTPATPELLLAPLHPTAHAIKKRPRESAHRDTTIAAMQLITQKDPTHVFNYKPPGRGYG